LSTERYIIMAWKQYLFKVPWTIVSMSIYWVLSIFFRKYTQEDRSTDSRLELGRQAGAWPLPAYLKPNPLYTSPRALLMWRQSLNACMCFPLEVTGSIPRPGTLFAIRRFVGRRVFFAWKPARGSL
jgi:hypothetical protein